MILPFWKKYKVRVLGRAGLLYKSRVGETRIDSELCFGELDMVVFLESIREWEDGREITPNEKAQIILDLEDFFQNDKVEWVDKHSSKPRSNALANSE